MFMKRSMMLALAATAALSVAAQAADNIPVKATPSSTSAAPSKCLSSADCSGGYVDFGLMGEANNTNFVSSGVNGASNDLGLMVGGGYQLWKGQVLAGIQANVGYEFAGQGQSLPGGNFFGMALVQLGYNFFPSTEMAPTTPGQSPLQAFVPANLLAASTPYFNAGGCLRHGIMQGCAGAGVQTVIASGWSTAFDYINMPSQKNQPDDQVFMIKLMKHF